MQKRIFLNFTVLILICILGIAILFSIVFLNAAQNHEKLAIRDQAYLISELLNQGAFDYSERIGSRGTRLTIISSDGWVLMDSNVTADLTINRGDRPEFISAITYGSGEAVRGSDTFGVDAYYYAIRLSDGNVVRVSRTLNSLGAVFPAILPIIIIITLAILILAYFVAFRLTRRILRPLAEVDFENKEAITDTKFSETMYEELWPYIRKINHQKQEIAGQLTTLRDRAETIEAIIANMREGLVILNEKGLVMAVNQSTLDIFEIAKADDIMGKNSQYIYRDPEFVQCVKKCIDGERLEMNFARNDKMYNVFFSPVTGDESTRGVIIFFLDATEQFKAERQRKEFTANVSHELKTPLTTIYALAEMMSNGMAKTEDVADFSLRISEQTRRLIDIIEGIIRLSEFDESKVGKDFNTFNIYDVASQVIAALKEKAEEKAVTVELTGSSQILTANIRLLDELMYNLVENGIKYNKEGGKVTLDVSSECGFCKITVTDTGMGIAEEHKGRIFERFYRADSSRSKKTGGTGLGLSIVKHITEHHNGRITLESTEDVGTTIVCYIPMG